jgi:phytoene/squalene synthetase
MRPPSGGVNSLDVLYAQAAEAARTGSHGFSLATRFFPLDLRRAAHAVYWFCYYTRRLATQAENPEQGRADLDRWAWMVAAGLRGELAIRCWTFFWTPSITARSLTSCRSK